jgi:3-methyl-2-oxobutanoate hydroxymethyltransferase
MNKLIKAIDPLYRATEVDKPAFPVLSPRVNGTRKKVRVPDLSRRKEQGERIVMLTAYDATMARLFDRAGIDLLLVGDSLGHVILGLDTTIPVTLDAITHHTRAVTRGATHALVVADMPFLTYQVSPEQALRNAARLFQEGGAAAVKLEGGRELADTVRKLTAAGLPVMGHLGLTPQHVHRLGGMRRQASNDEKAQELILDALALEDAGAFAIVLEAIPDAVAETVTSRLKIPTIGIGAGPHCDGQVLVSYDILGLFDDFVPPFVKQYAQLGNLIQHAAEDYADDVRRGEFPEAGATHSHHPPVPTALRAQECEYDDA